MLESTFRKGVHMKSLSLTIAALALGATAVAQEGGNSLIFQQPKENGHLISLSYRPYSGVKGDTKNAAGATTANVENKPALFNLNYLWGMNNGMALGVETGFGSTTTTTTPVAGAGSDAKTSGMTDINLWLVGNSDLSNMVLRYGGNLAVSPGDHMQATTGKDGNNYSGGMNLRPYIGAEWGGKGDMAYGIAGSYQHNLDRKSDDQLGTVTSVTTTTGGNILELKPYVEVPYSKGVASFYLAYDMVGASTQTTSAAQTNLDAYTKMTVGADAKYDFSQTVAGRAGLSYTSVTDQPVGTSKTNLSGVSLDIGAVFSY